MANTTRIASNRFWSSVVMSAAIAFAFVAVPSIAMAQDYDGQAANAAWRTTADQQIDLLRKADINIQVELSDGTLVSGAQVQATMQRHEFHFGSAASPRDFLASQPDYFVPAYADKIEEIFNTITINNQLKWKSWSEGGPSNSPPVTQEGLDYLNARDIDVRGHNVLWTKHKHVPSFVKSILELPNPTNADKQNLYDLTFARINDVVPAVAGKVFAWDVLNEPRGNHEIEDILVGFTPAGEPTIVDVADIRRRWFQATKLADPNATLFLNEFGVLPGNSSSTADERRQTFRDQISDIIAASSTGGSIEGIGFESHFEADNPGSNKEIVGIPELLSVLDDFQAEFNLPAHITEFDYATTNQALQAEYTRDFMTAVFSHSSIEAFVTWGFWEDTIGKPTAALFDSDWNIKPNGQAYIDLVFDDWWTDENGNTDGLGEYGVRGFKGDYQIVVDYQGEQFVFDEVLSDGGLDLTVVIPGGGTNFLGGDVLTTADWDNGLPDSSLNPGTIGVSGVASDKVSGFHVTQTGGTVDFTHTQSSRSSLEDGTEWHLQGGVLTDTNSNIRLDDSSLFIEGGAVTLDSSKSIKIGKGTARIEVTAGSLTAKSILFGTITGATTGSKVLELGAGDGVVELLTSNNPLVFGDDGDTTNDYVNFLTGTEGTLITTEDAAYFGQLWDDGNLRIDDLTGTSLGQTFAQTSFSVIDNGNGTTTLSLLASQFLGDFNGDGIVDAADYTVWRDNLGVTEDGSVLSGNGDGGTVDTADYALWVTHFGESSSASSEAIPEPTALCLSGLVLLFFGLKREVKR